MNNFFSINLIPKYVDNAKQFIIAYSSNSSISVDNLKYFYDDDSRISLIIRKSGVDNLNEFTGFSNFLQFFSNQGVGKFSFNCVSGVAQPVGQNALIIDFKCNIKIHNHDYICKNIFIIKHTHNCIKIANQILEINI